MKSIYLFNTFILLIIVVPAISNNTSSFELCDVETPSWNRIFPWNITNWPNVNTYYNFESVVFFTDYFKG